MYRYSVYISVHSHFARTTKSTLEIYIICCIKIAKKKHLSYCTVIFENELFPTVMVQQRQQMDVLDCCKTFSELISMFVFDSVV